MLHRDTEALASDEKTLITDGNELEKANQALAKDQQTLTDDERQEQREINTLNKDTLTYLAYHAGSQRTAEFEWHRWHSIII